MLFIFGISIGCSTPNRQAIFEMKVTCKREGEKISQNLKRDNLTGQSEFVSRVFYSPKLNSCLAAQFTWREQVYEGTDLSLRIVDALSQKEIWSASYSVNRVHPNVEMELQKQIELLDLE
jgi:hypothetical protein